MLFDTPTNSLNHAMPMPRLHHHAGPDLHAYLCGGMPKPMDRRKGKSYRSDAIKNTPASRVTSPHRGESAEVEGKG